MRSTATTLSIGILTIAPAGDRVGRRARENSAPFGLIHRGAEIGFPPMSGRESPDGDRPDVTGRSRTRKADVQRDQSNAEVPVY